MRCLHTIKVGDNYFNCGRCRACRVNYTSQWTFRLACELSKWDSASFITLTYNDEHLPADRGLHKRDVQLFNKRLRNYLDFKFYLCGEYGQKGRPHYHGIYFGVNPFDCHDLIADLWPYCDRWQFDKRRGKKCAVGQVTRESMQYTVGYVQKKLFGNDAKELYGDRQRPFSLMSKGLGKDFGDENRSRFEKGWTYLNSQRIGIPRYFRERYGIEIKDLVQDPEVLKRDFEVSIAKFDDEYPNVDKLGLEARSRAYMRWFDNREVKFVDHVFQEYQQRLKLCGSKI